MKNREGKNNSFYGKHHTLKSKKKISLANRGKRMGEESPNWKGGVRRGHDGGYLRYTNGDYR